MRIGLIHAAASPTDPRPSRAACRGLTLIEALAERDPSLSVLGYGDAANMAGCPDRITWKAPPVGDDPWQELADRNPDHLDALLVLDPISLIQGGSRPPAKPLRWLAMLAVLDDPGAIRGVEGDLTVPNSEARAHAHWQRLQRYDLLLSTSSDHGAAWAALLGLAPERLHPIGDSETAAEMACGSIARCLEELLNRPEASPSRSRNPRAPRPKLAIFSPWPPKESGIADYAVRLARALQGRYSIDLYHEPGYIPEPALRSGAFGAYDARFFPQRDRVFGYRGVLYQMGNSFYHGFVYENLRRRPGVVTLHDYCLSGFQFWRMHQEPGDPFENLRRLIAWHMPERFEAFDPHLRSWTEEPGGFAEALARRGLAVNRDVFEAASAVILHSPWCAAWAGRSLPEQAGRVAIIPLGATPRTIPEARRRAVRERFGLPVDGTIIGVFGILSPGKMNLETIAAFREVAPDHPEALLAFIGADWEGGAARQKAEELGIADRVRFLGRQPNCEYLDLIGSVDLGISLRRPPTHGETSAALLDLLRHGVPTIVNEAGTFADYPASVVRRTHWEREGHEGLVAALRMLLEDRPGRSALGKAAQEHVREHHAWSRVAALYADVIEHVADDERGVEAVARKRAV